MRARRHYSVTAAKAGRICRILSAAVAFVLLIAGSPCGVDAQEMGSSTTPKYSLPSAIIENKGQWDAAARYQLSLGDLRVWFTDGGLLYDLTGPDGAGHVVRWSLVGADNIRPSGKNRESGWRSWRVGGAAVDDIPAYGEIFYSNLLDGVDARFNLRGGALKYDVILAPGVDPRSLRMRYEGADGIGIDRFGSLQVKTSAGILSEARPVVFQEIDGKNVPVDARFLLDGDLIGVDVGDYDSSRSLVIDPAVRFGSYLGGDGFEEGRGVQVDSAGNVYVVGQTRSANFPVTLGSYSTAYDSINGSRDIFIAKLDPTGRRLIWGTYAGGNGEDNPIAGLRLRNNRVIVAGTTLSSDFKVTPGVFGAGRVAGVDGFILSLRQTDGGQRVAEDWSAYLGGLADDTISAFDLNSSGNIILTGYTTSVDFQFMIPPGSFDNTPSSLGGPDVFVLEISQDGTQLIRGTFLAGEGEDKSVDLVVGAGNRITVAGLTRSGDFPVSFDALFGSKSAQADGFIAQLTPTMQTLDYGTFLGGSGDDFIRSVALDAGGRIYVTGHTGSSDFPDNVGLSPSGSWFVTRIDPGAIGSAQLSYSLYLTSDPLDQGVSVAVDNLDRAVLCGVTSSAGFPIQGNGISLPGRGKTDLALVRLAPDGRSIEQSSVVGGSEDDIPAEETWLSPLGDLYVTGGTRSRNFPLGRFPYDSTLNTLPEENEQDAFLLAWSFNARPNLVAPSLIVLDTLGCETEVLDTFYVYNDGDLPLTILANKFRISDTRFSLAVPSELPNPPLTIRPGDSLRYIVQFATSEFGTYGNDLQIYTSDSIPGKNPLSITMRAGRVAPSVAGRTSVMFGTVVVCRDTTVQFVLTNNNADAVTVELPTFEGGGEGFAVEPGVFPLTVPGRGTGTFRITFRPEGGGRYDDALILRVRECEQSTLRVVLGGRGEVQRLDGLPDSIGFPSLPFCSPERDTVISITNNGNYPVILSEVKIVGAGFDLDVEPSGELPDTLAPRDVRNLRFRFTPPAAGEYDAEAQIRIGPCDSIIRVRLVGSHPDEVVPLPSVDTLDFGVLAVCRGERRSDDRSFEVDNPSDSLIFLDAPILEFPFVPCGLSFPSNIDPGEKATFCLRYDPPSGNRQDTLRLLIPYHIGDCTDTLRVLVVAGRSVVELTSDAATIDLPPLGACESFRDTSLVLRNNSVADISLDSLHITRGLEVLEPTLPYTIPAHDSVTVRLRFAPTTSGISAEFVRFYFSSARCGDSLDLTVTGRADGIVAAADLDSLRFASLLLCNPPGESSDTVYLSWTGTTGERVRVASLRLTGDGGEFSLVDPASIIGRDIPSAEPLPVPILFSSGAEGVYEDTLEIVVEPCMDTIRVLLSGEVVEPDIEISGGRFGEVEVGTTASRNIIVANNSTMPFVLDTIFTAGLPFAPGPGFPALPATLGSGEVIVLPITFTPLTAGDFRDSISLNFSNSCDRVRVHYVTGTGVKSNAEVEFCIGGIYAQPGVVGDTVVIPVRTAVPSQLDDPVEITFLMRFDPARFQFLEVVNGVEISADQVKGEVLVRADAARTLPDDLPQLRLRILAGAEPFAVVRLDSVAVGSGGGIVPTLCGDSAIVSTANRCFVTGLSFGKFPNRLERPVPNPVNEVVEITFQQLEDAETVLRLWDGQGREVLRPLQALLPGGRYSVRIPVGELPPGVYFYGVQAGSWSAVGRMIIQR